MQLPRALLGQAQKIKKNPPLKNFVYFRKGKPLKSFFYFGKWNFSAQARKVKKVRSPLENSLYSNIKNFLIFSKEKTFLTFKETETLKKTYISGSNLPGSKNEKKKKKKIKLFIIFTEVEKIYFTLLILLAERQLFKYKCKVIFYPCPQPFLFAEPFLNLDLVNSSLFFFYFGWL